MMTVLESETIDPTKDIPKGHTCLYIRREMLDKHRYKEFSYIGPHDEVLALAERCKDLDMGKVDKLLIQGKSFEDAVNRLELGNIFRLRRGLIEEYWNGYLNPCCDGCRTGTADCDINPLRKPPTQADCALELMDLGECP